jgi:acyl-CoA hydrolase
MRATKPAREISAQSAAALVRSGDWVDYGFALGQPDEFDRALAGRASELRDVKIRSGLSMRPRAVLECDPARNPFLWFSWHFSAYDRLHHAAGRCNYIPMNFGEIPGYYHRFIDPVDVVCIKTAPIDADGCFNFGASTAYIGAIVERARVVVVETCRDMPHVAGPANFIHRDDVDYVIDGGSGSLPELPVAGAGALERKVARFISPEVEDGACLQVGIGALPNAVCSLLREANLRDLGVHTEMMVDGIADLIEAGVVTNARKQIDPGASTFTFAAGSRRLYSMLDRNPALRACAVDYTNSPDQIARNDKVVSVNSTAQIDLQGQAASEAYGHKHLTGTGGQLQFVRGAYASRGGKSFICLSSVYEREGRRESRIVSTLTPGTIVTTPRTDIMFVVTEFGIANLKGRSVAERARALIALAHPDFRETLEREAREKNLIPPRFG